MKNNFINKLKYAFISNSTTRLKNHLWLQFVKVLVWLYDIPSSHKSSFHMLLHRMQSLRRNSGDSWTVAYLKEAHRLCSHWLSGKPDQCMSEQRVAVRGLPLIIPGPLRNQMYKRNNLNYFRCVMTLLSVFRVMDAKLKLKIESITDPFSGNTETLNENQIIKALSVLSLEGKPSLGDTNHFAITKQNRLLLATSAGPNGPVNCLNSFKDAYALLTINPYLLTCLLDLSKYTSMILHNTLKKDIALIRYLISVKDKIVLGENPKQILLDFMSWDKSQLKLGKLSTKIEAAGKVRVFAMVDLWTQSILNPIHKGLFKWLSHIPMDGTFDQLSPIKNFSALESKERYSFDLSAATDRLPIKLQIQIMTHLFNNKQLAILWATVLVCRDYHLSFQGQQYICKYAVGQPMGALSSWAMLATTHHVIVQIAAQNAGYSGLFQDYSILGDDIVIANRDVAVKYQILMKDLGLEINLSKSLISDIGVIEFAKRWFHNDIDLSPGSPALITRVLADPSYLPTLVLDLLNRGINTMGDPEKFFSSSPLSKINKDKIKFALLPFGSGDFLKWLIPEMDINSFSREDLVAFVKLIDKTFNDFAYKFNFKGSVMDQKNLNSSPLDPMRTFFVFIEGEGLKQFQIHSTTILTGNLIYAGKLSAESRAPKRNFLDLMSELNITSFDQVDLTAEFVFDYLKDTLDEALRLETFVPDLNSLKGRDRSVMIRDSRRVQKFMTALIDNLNQSGMSITLS